MAFFLTAASLTIAAGAQGDEARFDRAFVAAMEEAAPEFRPQPRRPSARPREDGYRQWTTGDATVSVRYFVRGSADSASTLLRERLSRLSIGSREIAGYGDESYLLAPVGGDRRLWFRQGAVVLEVAAPDMGALRRFATLLGNVVAAHPQP